LIAQMNNSFKKSFLNKEYGKKDTIEHGLQFPLVMGVLNVTPDSFSDGGIYFLKEAAVEHALKMFKDGADIVDIGGESTRPGSESVTLEDEKKRVIPVIHEILKRKPDSLLSIDTTKSDVAQEACKAGVRIINDISGLTFDPQIVEVAKEYSASLVIMHIKGTPKDMQDNPSYKNVISEIYEFLQVQSQKAKDAGVDKIIIDPGIGFGKRVEDNLEILRRLNEFKNLGYPILVGLSRKSFLGKILGLEVNERDTITSVAETMAIMNGAEIIRTHNVVNAVNARELLNQIYSVKSYV
jgi:dihydropteroate synthase